MVDPKLLRKTVRTGKFYCHFCGLSEDEIQLVSGPAAVAICSRCVANCAAILARGAAAGPIRLVTAGAAQDLSA